MRIRAWCLRNCSQIGLVVKVLNSERAREPRLATVDRIRVEIDIDVDWRIGEIGEREGVGKRFLRALGYSPVIEPNKRLCEKFADSRREGLGVWRMVRVSGHEALSLVVL